MKITNKRLAITINLLRGVLLVVAGVLALVYPTVALKFALVVGGCLLIVDGVLGALASQNYGLESHWPFWLSMTRGGLAVVAGLAVLFSPLLASVLTPTFLATTIGLGAIAVGVIELYMLARYHKEYPPIWSTVVGALIYVALGVLLLLLPLSGALLIMQIGGVLVLVFGLVQIIKSWMSSSQSLGARQAH
ncbi:DUF308 domain-containing protein [Devosia sp. ZB163]|uniref:HdeD family acid-resistance protein n=1 Tax=Devosia sp. ZB163 TaxID=3025938 RepID=UPI00235F0D5D|nr:DUF308 domain-containing protein [Devosia sp. ZB163]MDC9823506.1 DUF308 domain-containing protein [Devosia sp. ZB163]